MYEGGREGSPGWLRGSSGDKGERGAEGGGEADGLLES